MIRSDLKVTTCLEFDCVEDMVEAVRELKEATCNCNYPLLDNVLRELECRQDQLGSMGLIH